MFSRLLAQLFIFVFIVSSVLAQTEASKEVNSKYRDVARNVQRFLHQSHFSRLKLEDIRNDEWIKNYMRSYDFNHMYFYEKDLKEFKSNFDKDLSVKLAQGDISAGFFIYESFIKRLDDRMNWIEARLKKPFDFSSDQYFETDRSESDWPKTGEEADDLWERRLKFDLLQERISSLDNKDKNKKDKESPEELVLKRYKRIQKAYTDYEDEDVVQDYLTSLTRIFDPHSQYMGPSLLEDFSIAMKLELFGIGAVLSMENDYCTVRKIINGGPADINGRLQVNDKIIGVAQGNKAFTDVVGMRLRNAVKLIRGEKDTVVRLKVLPGDDADSTSQKEITIVRDKINLEESLASAEVLDLEIAGTKRKFGILELPSFYGDISSDGDGLFSSRKQEEHTSTDDVILLLKELNKQKIDGLILDLRKNGGGFLSEAVKLVGLFIDTGPVVQIKNSVGTVNVLRDQDSGTTYSGPLIILTSKESASASEICAGALQNYGRALVVGDSSTHGKGTVQAVLEQDRWVRRIEGKQPKAGALKLTIQKFYLPNGHSTQVKGVEPDIKLPSLRDHLELGEAHLPHSLPWDEIGAARYKPVNRVSNMLIKQLQDRSQQRISSSPDFQFRLKEIVRLKKKIDEKKVSLNESSRIEEYEQNKSIREEQKNAIKLAVKDFKPSLKTIKLSKGKDGMATRIIDGVDEEEDEIELSDEYEDEDAEWAKVGRHARDLHLRETINILHDFLKLKASQPTALTAQKE
ncbi:MAG: carboxy terminal-processing peptidase [Verrucomicrobiota bacterium]